MEKSELRQLVINEFHKLVYNEDIYRGTWRGIPVHKTPLDCWIYQEIINEVKPDVIIETGTYFGGSTLFFADMLTLIGKPNGKVYSLDCTPELRKIAEHPMIEFHVGYSPNTQFTEYLKTVIKPTDVVLVNLDSGHGKATVLSELSAYRDFVTKGSYIIVEDSNINGHPVLPNWAYGEGPFEAITEFLENNKDFIIDKSREKFLLTFNPNGYLKKIS